MTYFYSADVSRHFDTDKASNILVSLRTPTKDFRELLEKQIRAAPKAGLRRLTANERVFLWLHVPACRDIIKFSELPDAAQSYIYVNDEALFNELFDPNIVKVRQNRDILRLIEDRKVLGSFFKRISDENLAALMHRYPIDFANAIIAYRVHKKSKLKTRLVGIFDCSKVRNQSHLRAFICKYPWIMEKQTLEMMEASPINRDTWARLIAEIKVDKRRYFPAGTGPWARRGIFVKHLKGRRSSPYKDFETGLPTLPGAVDNDAPKSVELQHDNDISTLDPVD